MGCESRAWQKSCKTLTPFALFQFWGKARSCVTDLNGFDIDVIQLRPKTGERVNLIVLCSGYQATHVSK
jgi:hypothetical protein